jgi:hypothetical protein
MDKNWLIWLHLPLTLSMQTLALLALWPGHKRNTRNLWRSMNGPHSRRSSRRGTILQFIRRVDEDLSTRLVPIIVCVTTADRNGIFGPRVLSSRLEMVPAPLKYQIVGRTGRQLLMERKVPVSLLLPGKRSVPSISPKPLLIKKGNSGSFAQIVRTIQRNNWEFKISVILIQHMLITFVPKPHLTRI